MKLKKTRVLTPSLLAMAIGGLISTSTYAAGTTEIGGLVEVEAGYSEDYNDNVSSDVVLATVEIGINHQLNDDVSASILLLYEEDDTDPIAMDEGTITIRNLAGTPLELTAGQMYLPFGKFETTLVSDPLPLELGEINQSAVQIGIASETLSSSIFVFKGDVSENSEDGDNADKYGFNIDYNIDGINAGFNYLSNLADTDAMQDSISDAANGKVDTAVAAMTVYGGYHSGNISVMAEYLAALDAFKAADFAISGKEATPATYQFEVAYTLGKNNFAFGYQGSMDAVQLDLPETRILVGASSQIKPDTTLAFELANDTDYAKADKGTGESQMVITAQLAVEF